MKRFIQLLFIGAFSVVLAIGFVASAPAEDHIENGLISMSSSYSVAETGDRLETVLAESGLTQFIRIDHASGAESVDLDLRPTEVIVFGNPRVGTPLMQCNQEAAIDLPQKALIWEDEAGQVWIGYNDPNYLLERHGLVECADVIVNIETALSNLISAAASPSE